MTPSWTSFAPVNFSDYGPQGQPASPGGQLWQSIAGAHDAAPSAFSFSGAGVGGTLGGLAGGPVGAIAGGVGGGLLGGVGGSVAWSGLKGAAGGALAGAGAGATIGALGGPVGAGAGALVGAGVGLTAGVVKGLVDQGMKIIKLWERLSQVSEQLAHQYGEWSSKLARTADDWDRTNERINQKWAKAIESVTSRVGKTGQGFDERWNDIKISVFKTFEPLLNKMLDWLTKIGDFALRIFESLTELLREFANWMRLIFGALSDTVKAPGRATSGLSTGASATLAVGAAAASPLTWPVLAGKAVRAISQNSTAKSILSTVATIAAAAATPFTWPSLASKALGWLGIGGNAGAATLPSPPALPTSSGPSITPAPVPNIPTNRPATQPSVPTTQPSTGGNGYWTGGVSSKDVDKPVDHKSEVEPASVKTARWIVAHAGSNKYTADTVAAAENIIKEYDDDQNPSGENDLGVPTVGGGMNWATARTAGSKAGVGHTPPRYRAQGGGTSPRVSLPNPVKDLTHDLPPHLKVQHKVEDAWAKAFDKLTEQNDKGYEKWYASLSMEDKKEVDGYLAKGYTLRSAYMEFLMYHKHAVGPGTDADGRDIPENKVLDKFQGQHAAQWKVSPSNPKNQGMGQPSPQSIVPSVPSSTKLVGSGPKPTTRPTSPTGGQTPPSGTGAQTTPAQSQTTTQSGPGQSHAQTPGPTQTKSKTSASQVPGQVDSAQPVHVSIAPSDGYKELVESLLRSLGRKMTENDLEEQLEAYRLQAEFTYA